MYKLKHFLTSNLFYGTENCVIIVTPWLGRLPTKLKELSLPGPLASTNPMFFKLEILKVKDIFTLQISKYIYRCLNLDTPDNLNPITLWDLFIGWLSIVLIYFFVIQEKNTLSLSLSLPFPTQLWRFYIIIFLTPWWIAFNTAEEPRLHELTILFHFFFIPTPITNQLAWYFHPLPLRTKHIKIHL